MNQNQQRAGKKGGQSARADAASEEFVMVPSARTMNNVMAGAS